MLSSPGADIMVRYTSKDRNAIEFTVKELYKLTYKKLLLPINIFTCRMLAFMWKELLLFLRNNCLFQCNGNTLYFCVCLAISFLKNMKYPSLIYS